MAALEGVENLLSAEILGLGHFSRLFVESSMDSQATQHMQGWIWPFGDGEAGFGYIPLRGDNGNAVGPGCSLRHPDTGSGWLLLVDSYDI